MATAYRVTITNDSVTRHVIVKADAVLAAMHKALPLVRDYAAEASATLTITFARSSLIE